MLTPKEKSKILSKYQTHEKDTGSASSQVAIFSEEIERLTDHLKKHQKDNSSRIGLLKIVAKRRRLLDYLRRTDLKRHATLIKGLGLKK